MFRKCKFGLFFTTIIVYIFLYAFPALASTTDGVIDPVSRWAYSENAGFLDFGDTDGNVHVTSSALSGYIWGENVGWISLNCSNDSSCATVNFKVANTTSGILSGYAFGENTGWIDFQPSGGGVLINTSTGIFSGYAWSENAGWINFGISLPVTTDWRPTSSSPGGTHHSSYSIVCTGRADLNNDKLVDLTDFSIGAYHWEQIPLDPPFIPVEKCKLNGDAKLNLTDFSIMAYYWTG